MTLFRQPAVFTFVAACIAATVFFVIATPASAQEKPAQAQRVLSDTEDIGGEMHTATNTKLWRKSA